MSQFDPQQYWNTRLGQQFSLEGVGWLGMSEPFNRWMYKLRRRVFLREVGHVLGGRRDLAVLDVGSGTGMYVDLWLSLGVAELVASDFTEVAVRNLRQKHPGLRVVGLDITRLDGSEIAGARFDVVSVMDVLFHIVDDDAYSRAIDNLVSLLKPGGLLVLTENFLRGPTQRGEHQVSRSREAIEALLSATGATLVRCRPSFLLMNTPVDSRSRLLHFWWGQLGATVRRGPRIAYVVGAIVYFIERIGLMLVRRDGPSTKLAIWRRNE
jgi:2-polyprenyl-3-methyl-5-hydroxy-6-metoxy-1,4-benzoquinol methylase